MKRSSAGIQVLKKQKISPLQTRKDSVLWGAKGPKGSVLGLRAPVLECQILCLEGSVISPSSGISWPRLAFVSFVHKYVA